MATNLFPPIFPLRPSDSSSQFLAQDLLLAYPVLNRGDVLKNYGSWGSQADLTLNSTSYDRVDGLSTLRINGATAASKTGLALTIPNTWSYAYWVKIDAAPTTNTQEIFRFQGPTEAHLRAWVDTQGVWSWQKYATADSYSILPPSDYPTQNMMLVISVFSADYLPPAQLRSNQKFTIEPEQPFSYTAYNDGQGAQSKTINGIYIGNNNTLSNSLDGVVGPLYFWGRPISETEVWQLWQDPYAPFRRNMEQRIVPSTLNSSSNNSLVGIGKTTSPKPLFQDDNALTINIIDYINYVNRPNDYVVDSDSGIIPIVNISVTDTYNYQNFPADSIDGPGSSSTPIIEINISDNYNYQAAPTDYLEGDAPFSLVTITVNDILSYVSVPSDSVISSGSGVTTSEVINVTDSYSYASTPTETVTNS